MMSQRWMMVCRMQLRSTSFLHLSFKMLHRSLREIMLKVDLP